MGDPKESSSVNWIWYTHDYVGGVVPKDAVSDWSKLLEQEVLKAFQLPVSSKAVKPKDTSGYLVSNASYHPPYEPTYQNVPSGGFPVFTLPAEPLSALIVDPPWNSPGLKADAFWALWDVIPDYNKPSGGQCVPGSAKPNHQWRIRDQLPIEAGNVVLRCAHCHQIVEREIAYIEHYESNYHWKILAEETP